MDHCFNEFEHGRRSLMNEFRNKIGCCAREDIRKFILQDRYVTEFTKKNCSRWISHNLTIAKKDPRCLVQEQCQRYNFVSLKVI